MISLFDSHCHLNDNYDGKTPEILIKEAQENGIDLLITVCCDASAIPELERISSLSPQVFHTAGVHPHEANSVTDETGDILVSAFSHKKCVAIGEIGLDYFYKHSTKEDQIKALEIQLDAAKRAGAPIVVHARDAEPDLLPMLQNFAKKVSYPPGVIHCFTGTKEFGQKCIDSGFAISFSGILTFKNAQNLRDSADSFPIGSILFETDSPFLAPMPFRGKKCEPQMVRHTALLLAEIKKISLEELSQTAFQTLRRVFRKI